MKYVRTKNGRIYKLQETKNGEKYLIRTGELIPMWNTKAYEILAQADTIEELCDYALYEERGIQQVKRFPEECNLDFIRELFLHGFVENLKFAILTTEGIINKAEMNKKGEVVLL